jgi:hypothetical protein
VTRVDHVEAVPAAAPARQSAFDVVAGMAGVCLHFAVLVFRSWLPGILYGLWSVVSLKRPFLITTKQKYIPG